MISNADLEDCCMTIESFSESGPAWITSQSRLKDGQPKV